MAKVYGIRIAWDSVFEFGPKKGRTVFVASMMNGRMLQDHAWGGERYTSRDMKIESYERASSLSIFGYKTS